MSAARSQHDYPHKLAEATNKPPSSPADSKESVLLLRPIATNSRIKQHKNLYLVFVNNALQQLERVRAVVRATRR